MKTVKKRTVCELCGTEFEGEFIQHETSNDDWDWEKYLYELSSTVYPHLHEQPTVECHICLKCMEIVPERR